MWSRNWTLILAWTTFVYNTAKGTRPGTFSNIGVPGSNAIVATKRIARTLPPTYTETLPRRSVPIVIAIFWHSMPWTVHHPFSIRSDGPPSDLRQRVCPIAVFWALWTNLPWLPGLSQPRLRLSTLLQLRVRGGRVGPPMLHPERPQSTRAQVKKRPGDRHRRPLGGSMQEGGEAHRVNQVCAETSLNDQRDQFP